MKIYTIVVTMTMVMLLLALPAGAVDYTLGIFGNANEDETINMQDVTYTELIILEYKDETQFADAKHDGEIDILDVTQIELVILGTEKELTLIDSADRVVTVNKPVERIIPLQEAVATVTRTLSADGDVIAVTERIKGKPIFYPEMSQLPSIGTEATPDYEVMIALKPDIIVQHVYQYKEELEGNLEPAGISVLYLNFNYPPIFTEEVMKLGYILDKRDEAEEFIDWQQGQLDTIAEKIEGLTEEDKSRVYMTWGSEYINTFGEENIAYTSMIEMAGGINIASGLPGEWIMVDPEWVLEQNPDVIIEFGAGVITAGYKTDDSSEAAGLRESIMSHPAFGQTDAAKAGDVYIISDLTDRGCYAIVVAYMAKLFYLDTFEEMNPRDLHQEYLDRFQGIDYNVYEHGVFLYPQLE